ncbi:hypothetical protein ACFL01_04240, partial [Planctomycetota bacterium]
MLTRRIVASVACIWLAAAGVSKVSADDFPKPYSSPCTERENTFEFTQKPKVKLVAKDKYEITFTVRAMCDVAVGIVDEKDTVVRHLGSGVLGTNAPVPFQKASLKQTVFWNGKDDLGAYVKEPGKLRVKVMLGLKPVFDKRLGDTNPKNLPGFVGGIAAGKEGVFLFVKGTGSHGGVTVRKFDHDGKYVAEVFPPRGDRPLEKYKGMSFIEYEPGKRTLHARDLHGSVAGDAFILPAMNGKTFGDIQPVLLDKRLFFTNPGVRRNTPKSLLHYIYTDGTTDEKGIAGRPFAAIKGKHQSHGFPRLAVSPDGRRMYVTNLLGKNESPPAPPVVLVCETEGSEPTTIFAGGPTNLGKGNDQFSNPVCVDVDAAGRVYVADRNNNRIQIFSADGKYLKTVRVDRPILVLTPKKTGGIYVLHSVRRSGKSIPCLTKLTSFEDPREAYHVDGFKADIWAIDEWAAKPRLWAAGAGNRGMGTAGILSAARGVRIFEEDGNKLRLIEDFEETHTRDGGESWFGGWSGMGPMGGKIDCDPVRGVLYYRDIQHSGSSSRIMFDLKTGAFLGEVMFHG